MVWDWGEFAVYFLRGEFSRRQDRNLVIIKKSLNHYLGNSSKAKKHPFVLSKNCSQFTLQTSLQVCPITFLLLCRSPL